ncbi:type I-G CRISPR-associated protein Csb2 [[Pseudopropionibacterium] massiliense]|uniref:type I-G CRISPR-associated protein Csb2 n=1 Tax=[Pseudopropionibacterium] massiliense TaxID=2220000 RepID=UPI001031C48B|nr:type I-U CRISPR-associated protein Csb2 [[Pseudopropionibacterium] massiliense]
MSGSLVIQPTTVRWRLEPTAPFRFEDGILAAHGLRGRILGTKKENTDLREQGSGVEALAGHHDSFGDGPQHRHPHWLWLPTSNAAGEQTRTGQVEDLVLWVPDGIPADTLSRLAGARYLPRWINAPKEYRSGAELHLQLMGPVDVVMHEYVSSEATRWVSVTPFLTDRFPKLNKPREEFAQKLVERELGFRYPQGTPSVRVTLRADWEDRDVVRFRRYRWSESMAQRRRGMLLQLDFDEPLPKGPRGCPEPLVLGSLSHFGFGLFRPAER